MSSDLSVHMNEHDVPPTHTYRPIYHIHTLTHIHTDIYTKFKIDIIICI